jgi:DNA invertase Pin-like site-specific DNA recombinase
MNKGMKVGYIRVSTVDQNIARQLENFQLDKVFIDKCSGKDLNRPEFQKMMNFLREGDQLFVHSMDRLARNQDDLRKIIKDLNSKGISVEFVKNNLKFTGDDSPMSNLLLSLLAAVAEFELELILERQREGIAVARAKGIYKRRGRHNVLLKDQKEELKLMISQGIPKTQVAKRLNISRHSVYNYLKEFQNDNI